MSADDIVARLHRLAAEAARLAAEIGEGDRVPRLLAAFHEEKLAVTHGGHRLFAAAGIGFAGPKPFAPEDVAIRPAEGAIEFETRDPLDWLAITCPVAAGRDVLATAAAELADAGALAFHLRAKLADGSSVEGPRIRVEGGPQLSATRLVRALPPADSAARTSLHIVLAPARTAVRLKLLALSDA